MSQRGVEEKLRSCLPTLCEDAQSLQLVFISVVDMSHVEAVNLSLTWSS